MHSCTGRCTVNACTRHLAARMLVRSPMQQPAASPGPPPSRPAVRRAQLLWMYKSKEVTDGVCEPANHVNLCDRLDRSKVGHFE
ncbi:unnamed protein product [Mesocestoides corti]|uniref:Uncharacterized protein n=1 Tax=Mesocestoides corti TaxID=53468 RepID=A0A0R3U763_MESCO|nr:unnamed protein product [Mesocestoides corti]